MVLYIDMRLWSRQRSKGIVLVLDLAQSAASEKAGERLDGLLPISHPVVDLDLAGRYHVVGGNDNMIPDSFTHKLAHSQDDSRDRFKFGTRGGIPMPSNTKRPTQKWFHLKKWRDNHTRS